MRYLIGIHGNREALEAVLNRPSSRVNANPSKSC
jgi:hypothetical protein